jgi:hypothetical protein
VLGSGQRLAVSGHYQLSFIIRNRSFIICLLGFIPQPNLLSNHENTKSGEIFSHICFRTGPFRRRRIAFHHFRQESDEKENQSNPVNPV